VAEGLVKVRVIQQASGPGSVPVGTILAVTPEEARGLCHVTDSQPTPFAVLVVEDRTETADAPVSVATETRGGGTLKPAVAEVHNDTPEPEVVEAPAKRGPGRPPGSTNRPKPQ
jgi:hypothetical protein